MSKRISLEEKACRIIEALVSDDFCEDLEFEIAAHNNFKVSDKDVEIINNKFTLIYALSHGSNPNHGCYKVHDNWRKLVEEKYDYFRRKKMIPLQK